MLSVLSANAGRVSTYDQLLRRVWRSRSSGNPRLVRAFIKKLRHKLGDECRQPTGFDQPLLHTMYVDKKLGGVNDQTPRLVPPSISVTRC